MTGDGEEENIAERGNVGDLTAGISAEAPNPNDRLMLGNSFSHM